MTRHAPRAECHRKLLQLPRCTVAGCSIRRLDDAWMIVELGDGQVAGLPSGDHATAFYQALLKHWPEPA